VTIKAMLKAFGEFNGKENSISIAISIINIR
jgi:hypothetical protein